jgi:hypothetical protein
MREHLVYLKIRPRSSIKVVDTTFVKNVFGRGSNPFDRGRKATKVSAIVDHKGVPLTYTFHKANKNDSSTLFHTLSKCKFLSKIYDCIAGMSLNTFICRIVSKKRQITPKLDNRIKIVVEHVFGWLDKYRRIILRSYF